MLTASEVVQCEGYFLELESGDLLRNVLPEPDQCENDHGGPDAELTAFPAEARFERISGDVTLPLEEITAIAEKQFGRALSGKIINRQTAAQPDGTLVTEEAESG